MLDAGDIEMPGVKARLPLDNLENAVRAVAEAGAIPVILGGDHTVTWPDVTGVARAIGWGRVSVIHFDAHADTGDAQFGSLIGHGLPMRSLIESGACRGDRFLQIGLRGYWPEPETLQWMAERRMRSFEMHEVGGGDSTTCSTRRSRSRSTTATACSFHSTWSIPARPRAPARPNPAVSPPGALDAVRRIAIELPVVGIDVVEVSPPYDSAEITAFLANRVVPEMLSGIAYRKQGGTWDSIPDTLLEGRT